MPIPRPSSEKDIGACMKFLNTDKPDMDNKQRIAICMSLARHGKPKKK